MKAYRFQLRCKPAQERALGRYAGQLRWIWNQALHEQRARHERGEKFAGYAQMCSWLTAWRHAPQTLWLAQGPIHPQQHVRCTRSGKKPLARTRHQTRVSPLEI